MAEDIVIRAEGLGKKYLIGHQAERERYTALRDVIGRETRNFARKAVDFVRGRQIVQGDDVEEFWALKDINFEVRRGEVLGIIGRNGAGKSTLLKILSRITEPSAGRVTIKGRVASLLEVGTGFHPELTGRENIYLNGAILGMTRAEIRRKFDEIVAFAEVERFLDTPVKRYSSGMYVRLAFAVAAHLEPEILVVDEVLAVGDAEFQKKCLRKMGDVSLGSGMTVLFVSHNLGAIRALCQNGLYLRKSSLEQKGEIGQILLAYSGSKNKAEEFRQTAGNKTLAVVFAAATIDTEMDRVQRHVLLDLDIMAHHSISASIDFRLKDGLGVPVGFGSLGAFNSIDKVFFECGHNRLVIKLRLDGLADGPYTISIDLAEPRLHYYDRAEDCINIAIESTSPRAMIQPFSQTWGYGSVALPIDLIRTTVLGNTTRPRM